MHHRSSSHLNARRCRYLCDFSLDKNTSQCSVRASRSSVLLRSHINVSLIGATSTEQVLWLERALHAAEVKHHSVLVFTHVPLYNAATKSKTLVWNCEDILSVLHKHRDVVVAVLAGHDHDGGYAVDGAGVHHITMNSALTAEPGGDCFAVVECHQDGTARFVAHGRACVESNTGGAGKAYPELRLAKGAQNRAQSSASPAQQRLAGGAGRE